MSLIAKARACTHCAAHLPLGPRPVFQLHPAARILIAAQAPGRAVHESGIPFDDASGQRLRAWLGVREEEFYDPRKIAILPMGFCYPGRASGKNKSGDLPPRPECAALWRAKMLALLPAIELTLALGRYAQEWHLGDGRKQTLTQTVRSWADYAPACLPLPHPSPRNNIWLRRNPWFERVLVPVLQERVREILNDGN